MQVYQVKQVLARMRARIQQGWCQDALAQDSSGRKVPPMQKTACRWCMEGALAGISAAGKLAVLGLFEEVRYPKRSAVLMNRLQGDNRFREEFESRFNAMIVFNDHPRQTKERVLAKIDQMTLFVEEHPEVLEEINRAIRRYLDTVSPRKG